MSTTEIVKVEPQTVAIATMSESESFLRMIADASRDPSVDVGKMQELMAMKERWDSRQAKIAFSEAMARLQPLLPRITKHGRIEVSGQLRSTYAKIEDIDATIRPLYTKEGFSISWNTQTSERGTKITGELRHVAGHSEPYEIMLAIDSSGSKNTVQGMGSTFSYGKRYLLCGMFNLITVDEDDDAQGGGADPINEDQKNRILDLILHTGADETRFRQYMAVDKIEAIKQRDYKKAIAALNQKAQGRRS